MKLYHGSGSVVEFPEIRKTKYTKDFFYSLKALDCLKFEGSEQIHG